MRWILPLFFLGPGLWGGTGLLEQGVAERKQGRFEESILSLQAHLRAEPGHAQGWHELGMSYAGGAQYEKAADAFRLSLSHGNPDPRCHCSLSFALRESFKTQSALTEARRCLELLPENARAWNLLGNIETDLGDFEAALQAYQKALQLAPDYVNAQFNLGLTFNALGRSQEAAAALKGALKLQPGMSEAWSELGRTQLRQNLASSALKSFKEARRLSPKDPDAAWGLSRAWQALGERGRARQEERSYRSLKLDSDNQKFFKPRRGAKTRGIEAWDRDAVER